VHGLVSFLEPLCGCDGSEFCRANCIARQYVEKLITRSKQRMGQALAKKHQTNGRPYFSRGWDLTPIRRMPHFRYHIETYLPRHANQGGTFRLYKCSFQNEKPRVYTRGCGPDRATRNTTKPRVYTRGCGAIFYLPSSILSTTQANPSFLAISVSRSTTRFE
jgi:hypothetical protein